MKKRIVVVGAVLVQNGKIFAAQRGPQMGLAGLWEFPGGKIEAGESPQEALIREIREELACEIQVNDFVTTTDHEYDFGIVSLTTYLCELIEGYPRLAEHDDSKWLEASELFSVEWAPADVPAVEILQQRLN